MRRRLRICYLAPGTSVHTQRWLRAMAERGHEIHLITHPVGPHLEASVYDPYARMGLLTRVPKVRALFAEWLTRRYVVRLSPDIVHIHFLAPHGSVLRLVRRFDPVVVSVWGNDLIWDSEHPEPRSRRRTKARILAHARAITAASRYLAARTEEVVGGSQPVTVVPFGVDCERFRPFGARSVHGVPVVGYVKHYLPKYGPDVLLRAAALLARSGQPFRLEMYGTHDPAPYRNLARALGLEARTRLEGAVEHEQVPEILNGFDVFAMPSVYQSETFGVAALEASACGVPVVASRVGGVPETVRDQETGFLVPPADPEALAGALARLLRDPLLRKNLGEAARQFVVRTYRWQDCVTRMEEMYFALTEKPTPHPPFRENGRHGIVAP